jgi:hypothetical protein
MEKEGYCSTGQSPQRAVVPMDEEEEEEEEGRGDYFPWVKKVLVVKLNTHLHLVLRLGMGGAMSPFSLAN